ncbi:MAG: DUF433 domain-containing protein [Microcystis novacekii Mn_MB_F_20050700_S1]|uniref:DUF433 domain-containing protein n=1 Tax=Microcystis novacekii Mn_MB_F_20050700_S1D TaxID=2486266 RepID=A0A552ITQ6_9CHRO|nr:MAG: DUF433 domain-containing protein [Microcystis novacekii Mn_MB_F_20050700_S1]TRU86875.1 MAG: DUF433 domain-containing protein [Microcystis novacekii Mn_MB_F_20050700_S1D]
MAKYSPLIHVSPETMSGVPVFSGTRVPIQTLFDYLKAGESIDDFLEGFPPTVTREPVISLLEESEKELIDRVA